MNLLPYPDMAWNDYFINLYPGQKVNVKFHWCDQPVSDDPYWQYSRVLIKCDNKEQKILWAEDQGHPITTSRKPLIDPVNKELDKDIDKMYGRRVKQTGGTTRIKL